MGDILNKRRHYSAERLQKLRSRLSDSLCDSSACVYVTGSYGRGEAGKHSDLDIFIVGQTEQDKDGKFQRRFKHLSEITLQAELIDTADSEGFKAFSNDGEYLNQIPLDVLVNNLGKSKDDFENTLTARLLLLLESKPLLCANIYEEVIGEVITSYWRNYPKHKNDFMPGFLINDIQRMWRTFCVDYEGRTSEKDARSKAKRTLKNHKLKHSRLLTCYSALLYLVSVYKEKNTVHIEDAKHMVSLTPTERVEWTMSHPKGSIAKASLQQLLKVYEAFLERTDEDEEKLYAMLADEANKRAFTDSAHRFGDLIQQALEEIGKGTLCYRVMVV